MELLNCCRSKTWISAGDSSASQPRQIIILTYSRLIFLRGVAELLEHYADKGKTYTNSLYTKSFRIIADHIRASIFMIADGVRPSNTDRGYILRRLIRRATLHANNLGANQGQAENNELLRCAVLLVEKYKQVYSELQGEEVYENIVREIWQEEKQFAHTLEHGLREFEKMVCPEPGRGTSGPITGEQAFMLFTTYGFPFEMTLEMAIERGQSVDEMGFKTLMEKHRETSREGAEQKFKEVSPTTRSQRRAFTRRTTFS